MNKKLISEMFDILGKVGDGPVAPKSDTPREVIGTFAVKQDISVLDEAIIESISDLDWGQVFEMALFATMEPDDFHTLNVAMQEGTRSFRRGWSDLHHEGKLEDLKSGAFVFMSRICPTMESRARFVEWCSKAVAAAGDETHKLAEGRSSKFKQVIPSGTPEQHSKYTNAAEKALTPVDINNKKVMDNNIFAKDDDKAKASGAKAVKAVERDMDKAAKEAGRNPEEMFLNPKIDVDRDKIRNS